MTKSLKVDYDDTLTKVHNFLQELDRDAKETSLGFKLLFLPEYLLMRVLGKAAQMVTGSALFIKTLAEPGRITDNHVRNIKEYIKAGKESGLKELEIKMSGDVGIAPGVDLTPAGIPVKVNVKFSSGGTTVIHAKY